MPFRSAEPPSRWSAASKAVVEQVAATLGFEWVVVTRKRGDDMVLLQVHDEQGLTRTGQVLPWADTFCARAFDGRAPLVNPDARALPVLREAAEALGRDVGASVSLALRGDDGELLGSLCALSPRTHDAALLEAEPVLEAFAGVLGALLAAELRLQPQARRAERPGEDVDQLTGIGNRQSWDRRLSSEERRCAAYGLDAGLLAVRVAGLRALNDRDGHTAGDLVLRSVATALREALGEEAVLARVAGDAFAALLPEADGVRLAAAERAVRTALAGRGVTALVGSARRGRLGTVAAWHAASEGACGDSGPDVGTLPAPVALPPEEGREQVVLRELLELARRQLGASIAFIGQWKGGVRVMRGVSSVVPVGITRGSTESLDTTYCQRIVDGRLPRVIPDTSLEPEAVALAVTEAAGIRSYVGVPVVLSDGSLYGTLCCLSRTPDPSLTDRDADFLAAIADSMARVLEVELAAELVHADLVARLDPLLRGERTTMVFQPVLSLEDGRVVGAEALARFGGEPRPVEQWFADAERAGSTGELELATARAALVDGADLPGFLAINLSATTLCSPGFPALLEGVDPARIVVEVSEHEQIADYAELAAVLAPWRRRGLRLAVDDAGAGFASLRHVLQLAPDLIKLDISLVRDIDTDPTRKALAAALTGFARQTGALVVAEGVETEQQREVLRECGVGLMQGWLVSGGVRPEQFAARWGARAAVPLPRSSTAATTATS